MKKTFLIAAAMLPSVLLAQTQAEVKRGSRLGGDCSGSKSSICTIEKVQSMQSEANALISLHSEKQILVVLDGLKLARDEQSVWLGRPVEEVAPMEELPFYQEESIDLNPELIRELRVNPKYMFIARGEHKIRLNRERQIELVLNLSDKK
ncbi:hypothetical protein [Myroides indicus]|uniref:Uncharacterized protein n=1 Tax=Myroides indicus TaxID=1323422 RepID=A0A4V3E8K3_9FLAO|nr:hypothetical protein [Myroides indicus]TDS58205.1 hypothetical protein C8P70_11236 [Myroides indicus]